MRERRTLTDAGAFTSDVPPHSTSTESILPLCARRLRFALLFRSYAAARQDYGMRFSQARVCCSQSIRLRHIKGIFREEFWIIFGLCRGPLRKFASISSIAFGCEIRTIHHPTHLCYPQTGKYTQITSACRMTCYATPRRRHFATSKPFRDVIWY